jgi:hypothetical protein
MSQKAISNWLQILAIINVLVDAGLNEEVEAVCMVYLPVLS